MIATFIRAGYNLPEAYFAVEVRKATSKKDIITVMELEQLTGSRLRDFYVETGEVRDANTISSLEQILNNPLTPYTKRLFSGFSGSGKTTELINLFFKMQENFNVIIFSAWNRLKLDDIAFESLLFEIVEDILNYLYANDLVDESSALLEKIIENITHWCSDTRIIKEEKREDSKTIGGGIDFLKGVFFKAKNETSSLGTDIIESTLIEKRKINDLIFECNKIFDYLEEKTGKETLIIIDDLEKISFTAAREFYKKNSAFIRGFKCKMVLTIPVGLIFHPDFSIIQNVFGEAEVLPMIKIKDKEGNPYEPGIQCLTEILARRLDLALFEKECYREAVKYSGGAIRELFQIVQRAALIEESDKITTAAMQKSINFHKNIFASRIQERSDEIKITFREYLDVLFSIHDGNTTSPEKNLAFFDLMRSRAVYSAGYYYHVHPLLDDFIKAYKKKGEVKGSLTGPKFIKEIENGYLREMELANFFCIEKIKLDNLQDKKEIYIVGENGDGKTILLQGILLALKGDREIGEIINFIKQNPRAPYYLEVVDDTNSEYVFSESDPAREYIAKNVFAYGVHRSRNDSDKADEYGYLTLFEEDRYLKNPVKWLQYLHHKEKAKEKPPIDLDTAIAMLRALLNQNVEIEVTPDAVTFIERQTRVEFSQLADGYKSVIIWVCDLLEKLSKNQSGVQRIEDFKGIVLLDEIELFLHPKWKYKIVRNLRHWFPRVQFIMTTHSSTVILGASKDAVFYKLYKENGVTKVSQPVSKISGLMLNAIVTSPLFDLGSAQAFAFEQDLPEELESPVFENKILNKIPDSNDRNFILGIYKKSKRDTGAIYILKDNLGSKEINRLVKILIDTGFKDRLDTSSDFLYFKIHREIQNRITKMTGLTEDKILDLVKEELDNFENSLDHA